MSVLIDSSAWIESFRRDGDPALTELVAGLVERGEAATAGIIKLELLRGAWEREFDSLRKNLALLPLLETREAHYEEAGWLGSMLRKNGAVIPTADLLIATLAMAHGVPLLHRDRHFDLVARKRKLQIYS